MPGSNAVTKTNFAPKAAPKPLTLTDMWGSRGPTVNLAKRVVADDGGQEHGAPGTHSFATYIPSVLSSFFSLKWLQKLEKTGVGSGCVS